jgi:hypothetical protein
MWKTHRLVPALVLVGLLIGAADAQQSKLWGEGGERWSPGSRLPDFSYAGYRHGEQAIPEPAVVASVTDFGAKPDDGEPDTAAFRKAVEQVEAGAIRVPAGRFILTDRVEIRKADLVLRGAGPDKTVLYFPKPLSEIDPDPAETAHGVATSNYSWSGGFLHIVGSFRSKTLTPVTAAAERGSRTLTVARPEALEVGQAVQLKLENDDDEQLINYLYAGEPGDTSNMGSKIDAWMVARIQGIDGNTVQLNRPLRFRVQPDWKPVIQRFDPTVTGSGIEGFTLKFPKTPYGGHFEEAGFNGINVWGVAHCWVRNVRFHNADSGMFAKGTFNTFKNLEWTTARKLADGRLTGHHGITLGGNDQLLTDFDFRCQYVHDITVTANTGNVISNGQAQNLSLDHHRRAPFANLFTNLDAGKGTRLWHSGGGHGWGKNCGAWQTFWNIRAEQPIPSPPEGFAPALINLVDVQASSGAESITESDGFWRENFAPGQTVQPADLHQAQLNRRLDESR